MDIRLLFTSLGITILCYLFIIGYRYLAGHWQWSCLSPGKYIYPKRIKSLVRRSVLDKYKVQDSISIQSFEAHLTDTIKRNNMFRLDVNPTEHVSLTRPFSERNFRYYLFLQTALAIVDTSGRNGARSQVVSTQSRIVILNNIFSSKYVRKALRGNDRSVILAEIIYRILKDQDDTLPYLAKSYEMIRLNSIIAQHEEVIVTAAADPQIRGLITNFRVSNHPVINKDKLNLQESLMFMVFVTLLTKWQ